MLSVVIATLINGTHLSALEERALSLPLLSEHGTLPALYSRTQWCRKGPFYWPIFYGGWGSGKSVCVCVCVCVWVCVGGGREKILINEVSMKSS